MITDTLYPTKIQHRDPKLGLINIYLPGVKEQVQWPDLDKDIRESLLESIADVGHPDPSGQYHITILGENVKGGSIACMPNLKPSDHRFKEYYELGLGVKTNIDQKVSWKFSLLGQILSFLSSLLPWKTKAKVQDYGLDDEALRAIMSGVSRAQAFQGSGRKGLAGLGIKMTHMGHDDVMALVDKFGPNAVCPGCGGKDADCQITPEIEREKKRRNMPTTVNVASDLPDPNWFKDEDLESIIRAPDLPAATKAMGAILLKNSKFRQFAQTIIDRDGPNATCPKCHGSHPCPIDAGIQLYKDEMRHMN